MIVLCKILKKSYSSKIQYSKSIFLKLNSAFFGGGGEEEEPVFALEAYYWKLEKNRLSLIKYEMTLKFKKIETEKKEQDNVNRKLIGFASDKPATNAATATGAK